MMALLGLGLGLIITAMTTKYRDLAFLVTFGVQLLMYTTTVIYPLSEAPLKYKHIIELNPMTGIIEALISQISQTKILADKSFSQICADKKSRRFTQKNFNHLPLKPVIQISNLSKIYRLGEIGTGTISRDLERWYKMRISPRKTPFKKFVKPTSVKERE